MSKICLNPNMPLITIYWIQKLPKEQKVSRILWMVQRSVRQMAGSDPCWVSGTYSLVAKLFYSALRTANNQSWEPLISPFSQNENEVKSYLAPVASEPYEWLKRLQFVVIKFLFCIEQFFWFGHLIYEFFCSENMVFDINKSNLKNVVRLTWKGIANIWVLMIWKIGLQPFPKLGHFHKTS